MHRNELSFFPNPYPDEDFRSIVHRYHIRSTNSEMYETKLDLFELKSYKNTVFPRNLSVLIDRLPKETGLNVNLLIEKHTLFPLFKPFLSLDRVKNAWDDILHGTDNSTSFVGRIYHNPRSKVISDSVRYCPDCLHKDNKLYGEVYAHRLHQLNVVKTCHKHGVRLITQCPMCSVNLSKNKAEVMLTTPNCLNGHNLKICDDAINNFNENDMYKDLNYLLQHSGVIKFEDVFNRIRSFCWEAGYFTYSGNLKSNLKEDFLNKYGAELLYNLGYDNEIIQSTGFWWNLTQPNSRLNNIHLLILLMRFLAGSVGKFFSKSTNEMFNPLPFGCGPWICVNKVCDSYQKSSIPSCDRSKVIDSVQIGRFHCSDCGLKYTISWNWETKEEGKVTITRMGPKWESIILKLYTEGFSFTEIATKVCSNYNKVRQSLVRKLGISHLSPRITKDTISQIAGFVMEEIVQSMEQISVTESLNLRIQMHRDKIVQIVDQNPDLSRYQINRSCSGSYSFLMKYDKEWLTSVLPQKIINVYNLDFNQIDTELSVKVKETAEQLYKSNPNTRIKSYSILNSLDDIEKSRFIYNKDKFPITETMILQYTESNDEYLIRHLPSIVNQLLSSGYRNVTMKSITSFRRSYRNITEETHERIEEKLRSIQDTTSV
jgi:hypothetical protein